MVDPHEINIQFTPESLQILNVCLGFIMFGIALEIKPKDFQHVARHPKPALLGVLSQFLLLPAVTFLLVYILQPHPAISLGLFLVAACPGGNISNFISHLSKGNSALSISLTAIATLLATLMTPVNFAFWSNLDPATHELQRQIHLNPWDMVQTILLLMAVPISLGLLTSYFLPIVTEKLISPVKILSILFFVGFIVVAFVVNFQAFLDYIHIVIGLVFVHNFIALGTGFSLGKVSGLSQPDVKSITIETGIQNSGLGLILIFNFFDGFGGMALVAAWWGVWHIISGLTLAFFWSGYWRKALQLI